ncbi:barstar family protein [Streptomyces sp. ISL-100]|uniref:barstar family protein n=1 Tax=Streptomyces sp. ISL-100 TaxID=2819173 RepID=UPI001BECFBA1|nr:barstar family protein [Streptomyces sp. ISL-100]MBT2394795.1 barstar family protein [Streptomyces sp. ISL-100]
MRDDVPEEPHAPTDDLTPDLTPATASDLTVDLRGIPLGSLDDFWDAVAGPCGLPEWFGRNLDAWWDAIESRGISEVIDAHGTLVVRADAAGLFAPGRPEGARLASVFADASRARLEVERHG